VATLSFAVRLLVLSGLKVTPMVQDAPGASESGQSLVCANQDAPVPVTLMPFTMKALGPLL